MNAREAVERLYGGRAENVRQSGSIFIATLENGEVVVAKDGAGTAAEAAGLRWLGEHDDVPVPTVHGHDEEWLVLQHIPPGAPSKQAAEKFGRGLACLHRRGAPAFGSPPPGGPADAWMGLAPMRNEPHEDWPTFYARHRIEPYVRMCVEQGLFAPAQVATFDRLCAALPEIAGPSEPPARLHGDAWSGNMLWSGEQVWLIDPAA